MGLPFGGRLLCPEWALSLKLLDVPLNTQQSIVMVKKDTIVNARNRIVDTVIETKAKYLFFLDDDVIVPKQTLMALGWVLNNNPDTMVATGIYTTKQEYNAPVLFKDGIQGPYWDWRVNDIFDVDACGAGCLMIDTDVFQHLEKPYFRELQEYRDIDGTPNLTTVSEDVYFCQSVRKAGFKIKAHGAIICPHYDEKKDKFYTLSEDALPYKRERERQEKEQEVTNG